MTKKPLGPADVFMLIWSIADGCLFVSILDLAIVNGKINYRLASQSPDEKKWSDEHRTLIC